MDHSQSLKQQTIHLENEKHVLLSKNRFFISFKTQMSHITFYFLLMKRKSFQTEILFLFAFLFIFCFCCLFYFLYWPLSFRSKNNLTKQNSFDSLIPSPFLSFISFDVIVFFVQSFHWQKSKIMGWVDGEEWYWNDMFLFRFFLILNLIWKQTCIEWIVCYVTNVQQTPVSW